MIDLREIKSFARSFLDSQAFEHLFDVCFKPMLKTWVLKLVTDATLDPGERRGIVIAMQELHAGFTRAYEECELDVPEWLDEVFHRGPISE